MFVRIILIAIIKTFLHSTLTLNENKEFNI